MNVWDGPPPSGFALEGIHFAPAPESRIDTDVIDRDVQALRTVVEEASRQADLVFVALHCHEGIDGRWNTETPANFLQPLAHTLIDAGAHGIFGTGPHMLRGMELYRGRPICYSLGNFIFTLETIESFPVEVYEQQRMPLDSTAADLYDRVTGYKDEPRFWETVLAEFVFEDGVLVDNQLVPVTMGNDLPRSRRGRPQVAGRQAGEKILKRLSDLSEPFDAIIDVAHDADGLPTGKLVHN
jgi:poly-gamma-glutamate capsule biosynthesis protein CapA/YwtB (metallophosphatase superfamily)